MAFGIIFSLQVELKANRKELNRKFYATLILIFRRRKKKYLTVLVSLLK